MAWSLPLTLSCMLVVRVSEIRKWTQGCYTLVHDTDCEGLEVALALVLYVGCQGEWSEKVGAGMLHISSWYWHRGAAVCPWPCLVCWLPRWESGSRAVTHKFMILTQRGCSLPLTLSCMLVVKVRKWEQGCYTLVHDTDTEGLKFALDLVLYVGCQGEKVGAGMLHISSWYR